MPYGFTYAGIHSDDMSVIAQKTTQSILPPMLSQTIQVPCRPGLWYIRTDFGARYINVGIAIDATDTYDLRNKVRVLAAWLNPMNGPQALTFDNEPDKTYYAVLDEGGSGGGTGSQATDITQIAALGQGTLTFLCPDPFVYGTETSMPFSNDAVTLNVDGTTETCPRIEVTFTKQATNFTVTHTQSGKKVILDTVFNANDTLTIDCAKQLIEVNGSPAMADLDLSSDFFALSPGVQNLQITPTGVSTATIYWTPRWL
jgi:predicted phage tail component-like protein